MRIGVDLGGSKIEIVALDDGGGERLRRRVPTPRGNYEATLGAVKALVDDAERELGQGATIGLGTPGALSRADGRIKNANSTCLNGRPLLEDLQRLLGRQLRIANDANCLALSESVDGAAAGAEVVFAVILGTGVGGGIAVAQRVLAGVNGIAGEWGHNPLPLPGARELPLRGCYCGREGCIEAYLSGPALAGEYRSEGGAALDAAAIGAAAAAGEVLAEACLARYEARLAKSLAGVINILDPEVIVLGGGLSNLERLYSSVPRLWASQVFSDRVDTRLVRSAHGDSSGVRGAAWLWPA